jgi:hypothetical protein
VVRTPVCKTGGFKLCGGAEWFDSFTTHLQRLRLVPKQVS